MAIVKAETFRTQTADELKAKLLELKKEQLNLRFKVASGEMENPARMRICLLYTSPSPRDGLLSRMPSSA